MNRHALAVRICHWFNVPIMLLLLATGLQIFDAHPALYWGVQSNFEAPWLAIDAVTTQTGDRGVLRVAGVRLDTTGLLGVSKVDKMDVTRAFPAWATLPSSTDLATGRRWHFAAAWLLVLNGGVYLTWTLVSGHLRRDLWLRPGELGRIGRTLLDHARLRFPKGEEALAYNVLQKLSYLFVVLVGAPGMVLTGLTMSPRMDAQLPFLVDAFGGRQSARSIHFLLAGALVAFGIVHLAMVVLSGPLNEIRSMITGKFEIKSEKPR